MVHNHVTGCDSTRQARGATGKEEKKRSDNVATTATSYEEK